MARNAGLCEMTACSFLGLVLAASAASADPGAGPAFYASPVADAAPRPLDECRDIPRLFPPLGTYCESQPLVLGWKHFGGRSLGKDFSLEGGFARVGHHEGAEPGWPGTPGSGTALFAGMARSAALTSTARGTVKVGVVMDSDLSGAIDDSMALLSGLPDQGAVRTVFGLGLERQITNRVRTRIEWDRYDYDRALDTVFASFVVNLGR